MYLKILFSLFILFFLYACTTPTGSSDGSSGGIGYQVTCNDGTTSNSGGKQGACSHHGGVREYNTNTLATTNYYPYSPPTTSNTINTNQTVTLGTYKGEANIKIQEQYSSEYTYLSTTCTLSIPISINSYEREHNPFNLKCTTDDNTSAYSFEIISASIINTQTYEKLVHQYWDIKQINESFEGTLVDKHYTNVINLFRGKNNKTAIYYFKNGTKLSTIYNKSNDSLIINLRGEGDTSSYPSTTATYQATMNLTKAK